MTHAVSDSSLLLTLEEISRLVAHSHDPGETLANIVHLIQDRFHTDVCSVYLLEAERNELVLGATIGLNAASVGRVRMRLDEGLTGLVAERLEPVMVDDAFSHPRFRYFPEAGEDPYHSFLGVPLVEYGVLQGVLVVQTVEPRAFSSSETRMLVTVASQLAPLVSGAQLLDRLVAVAHEPTRIAHDPAEPGPAVSFQGASLSPGSGQGEVYLANGFEHSQQAASARTADAGQERTRLDTAVQSARNDITRLSQQISALVGEDHGAILQAQLMILEDRTIDEDVHACVGEGWTAEAALLQTLDKYVTAFQKLATPFFQERIFDVKDVFRRILWHLRPRAHADAPGSGKLVLVAHEASVMDLFSVGLDRLAGVVVERGGAQSHAAILARSLGVPMVGSVANVVSRARPGRQLLVDGTAGTVVLDPPPAEARPEIQLMDAASCLESGVTAAIEEHAPGRPRVEANINLLCEVPRAVAQGAAGVGLFRSEFLFLARRTLPTEDEQVGIYRKLLETLAGRPATIRTFDLRPDKLAHCAHLSSTASGPYDWRQVLVSPPLQKLFKEQVRAILRAGAVGPARILVPLVTSTEQLDFILRTVDAARGELRREALEHAAEAPLGIMIEVAAAAVMARTWARRVDFFALGTNDLAASALGVDRDDSCAAGTLDPLHPGLLRLVQHVVAAAHQRGRRVTVCGEMAGTPEGAVALAAFEVDSLSVAVNQLPSVRDTIRRSRAGEIKALAPRLRRMATAGQVRKMLRSLSCRTPPPRGAF